MKTYLGDIIDSIKRYSKKLDDVTILKNIQWRLVDEEGAARIVYIFRDQNELLVSRNGAVEKGKWMSVDNDSLLIEIENEAYLFSQGFYNEYALGLEKDGVNEYAIWVNEKQVNKELNSLTDLSYISELLQQKSPALQGNKADNLMYVVGLILGFLLMLYLAM